MLIDARTLESAPEPADVVIVGAGAVGLVLAVSLARAGCRVALLEAGGSAISSDSQQFFLNATTIGHPHAGMHQGRFRVLGGTTRFWGGQLVPGPPEIFGRRPWVSSASWPIGADALEKYGRSVFRMLGMGDVIASDAEVWRKINMTSPPTDPAVEIFFSRWAPEPDFSRLFADDVANNPLLRVYLNAPVVALVGNSRIAGVVTQVGERRLAFLGQDTVLANGTIEISRLLQLPLDGGALPPWQGNPWLGRGFLDHTDCIAGDVFPQSRRAFHDRFDNVFLDGFKYAPRLYLSESEQRRRGSVTVIGRFEFNSSIQEHLVNAKIFVRGMLRGRFAAGHLPRFDALVSLVRVGIPMVIRYLRDRRMYNPTDKGIKLVFSAEQRPLATSAILLGDEKDALGMPRVSVNWEIDGGELEMIAAFAEDIARYLRENGLARVNLDSRLAARDPAFIKTFWDANHQMGGARMATSPEHGVVDSECAVHGAHNLHVAGAAVFPTSGSQNPTFLAMALALRLADRLAARVG